MTVSEIIEAFGGSAAMAELFGVGKTAVSNWRTANSFPDYLRYRISREAEARGIAIDQTVMERPAPFKKETPAETRAA